MKRVLVAIAAVAMAFSAAGAEPVTVKNYSWLQLAPGAATSFVGNPSSEFIYAESSHVEGPVSGIRWGNYQWIPGNSFTDYGVTDYWAGIRLDQPRNIAQVNVSLWCSGHETISHFFVEAIVNDAWTVIGEHTFTPSATGASTTAMFVDVKESSYQYIRVRFDVDGYEYAYNAPEGRSYGGPGVTMIEPLSGETTLNVGDRVNYANKDSFPGATVTNSFDMSNGDVRSNSASLNNGTFRNDQPWNGMGRDMAAGEYIEIDLATVRSIDNVTIVFMDNYSISELRLWVSEDKDGPFKEVLPLPNETYYPSDARQGAVSFDFSAEDAQFVRITHIVRGGQSHWSAAQILVNGTVVPEPATMTLLAMGGLAMLRRR